MENKHLDSVVDRNTVSEVSCVEIGLERTDGQYQLRILDFLLNFRGCDASNVNLT